MNTQTTIPPEVLAMPVSEAAHSLAACLMETEDMTNYPADGLALAFATGVHWEKAQASTHEPVLQAIGANLLQAPTKLTSGWVTAATRLLEQLLHERQHLYTDAAGAWPAPAPAPGVLEALQFYADKSHFTVHDEGVWDTVSGEPQNFWEDDANSATVEDGSIARLALEAARAGSAPEGVRFDMLQHLARQREFSEKTFGPGVRTQGVVDHIRKELLEIEANPADLTEWIDVVILALDGAWRAGGTPAEIVHTMVAKQTKNEGRQWPDWRTAPLDKAIEHVRVPA